MTGSTLVALPLRLALAIAIAAPASAALAQHTDHSTMDHARTPMPTAPAPKSPAKKPARKPAATTPAPAAPPPAPAPANTVDHAAMGHDSAVDHAAMGHDSTVDHAAMGHGSLVTPTSEPREPIPPLTDADREAAFPDVQPHGDHDRALHSYLLLDRLETWDADGDSAIGWEAHGWLGGDLNRLWLRSEGEALNGSPESADLELLYGRSLAPWWDLVAGVRHDFGEGPSRTYAAIGLVGLSPYKFEIDATAYLGQSGQTALRLAAEYDTLLSNRLILQWHAGVEAFGQDDLARGVGSGLSTAEAGLRLRYEVTRRFAPYIGVSWERAYGQTGELRRSRNEDASDTRFVAGLRFWF